MREKDLLKAIGNINEKYLIEAQEREEKTEKSSEEGNIVMGVDVVKQRKTGKIVGRIAAAAAVMVLIGGTVMFIGKGDFGGGEYYSSTQSEEEPLIQLVNKMTETELARVDKHSLTLLDEPEDTTESEQTEHKISIEFHTYTADEIRTNLENTHDQMTDEEYERAMEDLNALIESGEDYRPPIYVIVDGKLCTHFIPYSIPDYDGGEFSFGLTTSTTDSSGASQIKSEKYTFNNFDEYLDWIREEDAKNDFSEEEIKQDILNVTLANEALKTGNYETLPEGTVDVTDESLYIGYIDYRDVWEYDRSAVEAIKDSVDEINIYDEELDTEFLVHVTLPPNYDENKTYPVFFLTDGVWRFGNHPELRKLMENGEAAEIILVSLGYNYHIDGTDGNVRFDNMVIERDKLLDFITDNLMPYLGENYNIDYADSTLYGHSDGGVFTHNALFKSDLYENQPFGRYIIGSPALWGLYNYNEFIDNDSADCKNDYGYFDRNEKLDKSVFLCAGALEDPDYDDKYNGHDTTLEGVAKLKERLESHGADLTYKLYDSHHYQFIPEMLCEVLMKYYPA